MKKFGLILLFVFSTSLKADFLSVAEQLSGTSSHTSGPNCWNGALYAAGVLSTKRFIRPEEWLGHLKDHCNELDGPQVGAVGRIFHEKDGEVHGFIHLSDEMIFAKHGEDSLHGYQIMTYEEMLEQYGKTRNCRIANDNSPSCFHQIKYYDCNGQASFLKPLEVVAKAIEDLVFLKETKWYFKVTCEDDAFIKRVELLRNITSQLELLKREISQDEELKNQFVSEDINKYFLESISHQLYNIQVSLRNFRCKDRKLRNEAFNETKEALNALRQRFN